MGRGLFDIKRAKRKMGEHTVVVPLDNDVTKAIIDSMEDGDMVLSPYSRARDIFNKRFHDSLIIATASRSVTLNAKGDMTKKLVIMKHPRDGVRHLHGTSINTLFVDNFLHFPTRALSILECRRFCSNVIMISENTMAYREPSERLREYSPFQFYDGVVPLHENFMELPSQLFML